MSNINHERKQPRPSLAKQGDHEQLEKFSSAQTSSARARGDRRNGTRVLPGMSHNLLATARVLVFGPGGIRQAAFEAVCLGGAMLIHAAVAAFTTRRLVQRECPICGHVQMAPISKMQETVTCERCDYRIQPRRKSAA